MLMFRIPQGGNPKEHLTDEQFEFAGTYLARTKRLIFLRGPIIGNPPRTDSYSPSGVIDDILAMNIYDSTRPIYIVIDSGGGLVDAGLALYDVIKLSRAPVITIGMTAASMATVLLAAGTERLVLPSTRVMMPLPIGGVEGDVNTIKIRSEEMQRVKDQLIARYMECGVTAGLVSKNEKQIRRQILKDIDRENWMDAEKAIRYGLADRLVQPGDLFDNVVEH